MVTVFYSPHATSVDNEAGRASGHADVPLSPAGRLRAQELGQHYTNVALDAILCSDLQRAVTTAQIAFGARQIPVVADARLREYDYGALTQAPVAVVEAEFPRRIRAPFPQGESLLMVVARVGAFLREVAATHAGQTLVVIGHRATRYGLAYWCAGMPLEEIVGAPWPWLEVPIWRYELAAPELAARAADLAAWIGQGGR